MRTRGKVALAVAGAVIVVAGTTAALGMFDDSTPGGPPLPACRPLTAAAVPVPSPAPATRTVATGLCVPWGLAFLPDGTALVSERDTARILSVTPDGRLTRVQEVPDVIPRGEAGLLGLAVSPTYQTDRWVYAYYTTLEDNRIARFHLGEQPQPILTGLPIEERHDGGRLAFGPDGMLYASVGDTDRRKLAQDPGSLAGKILRLTPDGRPAPGNPFPDSPVWSLGHRNVQGIAWDSRGRLFAAEFGQDRFDELNLIEPGRNYGWPDVEGTAGDPRFVDPIATWAPADASPSGIAIVGDRAYLACLGGQRLYRVELDGDDAEPLLVGEYGRLRTVAAGPDGALWILTSNRDAHGQPVPEDDRLLHLPPP
jgi:glucose/arabinose dehydrogenase